MNKMINQTDHTEALFDNFVLTSLKKQRETRELPIVKSPLRYPGGKSRAVPMIINNYIRKQKTLCSPFVGGGSIELTLAKRGTRVYAYDAFKPLVIFWQMLLKDASALAEKVREYEDMTPVMFYNLQKTFGNIKNQLEIAAVFLFLIVLLFPERHFLVVCLQDTPDSIIVLLNGLKILRLKTS